MTKADELHLEKAIKIQKLFDFQEEFFKDSTDVWFVGDLITRVKARALYRSVLTEEPIFSGKKNRDKSFTNTELLFLEFMRDAKYFSLKKLAKITEMSSIEAALIGLGIGPGEIRVNQKMLDDIRRYKKNIN